MHIELFTLKMIHLATAGAARGYPKHSQGRSCRQQRDTTPGMACRQGRSALLTVWGYKFVYPLGVGQQISISVLNQLLIHYSNVFYEG